MCYLITAGALFASYVSNKYTFLRVFKNPPMLNSGLSDIFSNYVAFALACSLALQSVMYGTYDDGSAAAEEGVGSFPIVALVFLLIYIFVPMPCLRAKAVETVDTKGAKFSKVEGLVNYECPLTGPLPSFESDEMEEARTDAKKPLARPGSAKWERQMSARSGKPQGAKRLTVRMPWSKKKPQSVTML
uniref:Uncharacterized protein n=1 Tax=Diacronema lutheri TaxID=2081491 RepID=A0A7R9YMZ5_DIALT